MLSVFIDRKLAHSSDVTKWLKYFFYIVNIDDSYINTIIVCSWSRLVDLYIQAISRTITVI